MSAATNWQAKYTPAQIEALRAHQSRQARMVPYKRPVVVERPIVAPLPVPQPPKVDAYKAAIERAAKLWPKTDYESKTIKRVKRAIRLLLLIHKMDAGLVLGGSRKHHIVKVRHQCIWLVYKHTKWSLTAIGHYFGGLDHTTILHALAKIRDAKPHRIYKRRDR